jgi:hypothetical protein
MCGRFDIIGGTWIWNTRGEWRTIACTILERTYGIGNIYGEGNSGLFGVEGS